MVENLYINASGSIKLNMSVDEFHRLIGKFTVKFETTMAVAKSAYYMNLQPLDPEVFEILFKDLTAKNFMDSFQALLHLKTKDADEELKIIDTFFDLTRKLISARNEVIHGLWMVSYGSEVKISASKIRRVKNKIEVKQLDPSTIGPLTEKIGIALGLFLFLNGGVKKTINGSPFTRFFNPELLAKMKIE